MREKVLDLLNKLSLDPLTHYEKTNKEYTKINEIIDKLENENSGDNIEDIIKKIIEKNQYVKIDQSDGEIKIDGKMLTIDNDYRLYKVYDNNELMISDKDSEKKTVEIKEKEYDLPIILVKDNSNVKSDYNNVIELQIKNIKTQNVKDLFKDNQSVDKKFLIIEENNGDILNYKKIEIEGDKKELKKSLKKIRELTSNYQEKEEEEPTEIILKFKKVKDKVEKDLEKLKKLLTKYILKKEREDKYKKYMNMKGGDSEKSKEEKSSEEDLELIEKTIKTLEEINDTKDISEKIKGLYDEYVEIFKNDNEKPQEGQEQSKTEQKEIKIKLKVFNIEAETLKENDIFNASIDKNENKNENENENKNKNEYFTRDGNGGKLKGIYSNAQIIKKEYDNVIENIKSKMKKLEENELKEIKDKIIVKYQNNVDGLKKSLKEVKENYYKKQNENIKELTRFVENLYRSIENNTKLFEESVKKQEDRENKSNELEILKKVKLGTQNGGSNNNIVRGGDSDYKEFEDMKKKLEEIKNIVLRGSKIRNELGNNTKLDDIPDIYSIVYNKFMEKKNRLNPSDEDYDMQLLELEKEFVRDVEGNELYSTESLKINVMDKLIFVLMIVVLKVIVSSIIEYMIEKEYINSITIGVSLYGIIYGIIFGLIILLVNMRMKTKILFAYMNMDINMSMILMHVMIIVFYVLIIYILSMNIDIIKINEYYDDKENEKVKLMNRIEIITNLMMMFTIGIIFII